MDKNLHKMLFRGVPEFRPEFMDLAGIPVPAGTGLVPAGTAGTEYFPSERFHHINCRYYI